VLHATALRSTPVDIDVFGERLRCFMSESEAKRRVTKARASESVEEPTGRAPSRQKRRTDQTRARLLDAGLAVILERGYDATSLSEITERADLGTGTLYLYFRDKRSLFEAIVRRELAAIYARWQENEAADPSSDPSEAVRKMIRLSLATFVAQPEKARLLLFEGPAIETWLPDQVAVGLGKVIGGPSAELTARMVISSTWAACRVAMTEDGIGIERLIEVASTFCGAGIEAVIERRSGNRSEVLPAAARNPTPDRG